MMMKKISSELCVLQNGIVMRGDRIVIPAVLRQNIVNLAHEGHMGVVKTKALIRTKVWFPGIDEMVENTVKDCPLCNVVLPDKRMHPLKMSTLPAGPWLSVSADFLGPFSNGYYCLVVIDDFSRFPIVETISSTSARTLVPMLDKIFSTHGVPEIFRSDNGPPFQSFEIKKFCEQNGIRHRKITPLWPRANALAENFMKPLSKAIKTATLEGRNWKTEMYKFLRNYRATPHVTTGVPPAVLLFNRNIRTLLPEIAKPQDDDELRIRDEMMKSKQKMYADRKNCTKPPENFQIGDTVVVSQPKRDKLSPPYNPDPMTVTDVKGTMVTAHSDSNGTRTRNSSMFK